MSTSRELGSIKCTYQGIFQPKGRKNTSIPVPTLHGFDHNEYNELGAPYMIMNYIDGLPANEMRELKNCEIALFGTVEQDQAFRRQMASIHAELARHTFDKIGRLLYDEQSQTFEIRKGPWDSSLHYFTDASDHAFRLGLTNLDRVRTQPPANTPTRLQGADSVLLFRSYGPVPSLE